MSKISKMTAIFIFFLILAVFLGILIKIPIDIIKQTQELKVGAFSIQFENETTEPEVKAILENCNMTANYRIDYNSTIGRGMYYIKVDKDTGMVIFNELKKNNITPVAEIKKGNYTIIMLSEEFVPDESFLTSLKNNNLQMKKSVLCYILLSDESGNLIPGKNYILEEDAIRIKNELETNEKILTVWLSYIDY